MKKFKKILKNIKIRKLEYESDSERAHRSERKNGILKC